jgi:hypothetical protein
VLKAVNYHERALALIGIECVNGALLGVGADLIGEPFHRFRACLENVAAVASNLRRNQWFQRRVKFRLQVSKPSVGKPAKRDIASAPRKDADPRLTARA